MSFIMPLSSRSRKNPAPSLCFFPFFHSRGAKHWSPAGVVPSCSKALIGYQVCQPCPGAFLGYRADSADLLIWGQLCFVWNSPGWSREEVTYWLLWIVWCHWLVSSFFLSSPSLKQWENYWVTACPSLQVMAKSPSCRNETKWICCGLVA